MNIVKRVLIAAAMTTVVAGAARGQTKSEETGHVALDIGSSAPVAVLWKLTDDFALRPDFTFVHFSSGGAGPSSWRFNLGASALASLSHTRPLTTYIGVRGAYGWYSQANTPSDWSAAGIFGARYAIDSRVGISAETGAMYDKIRYPSPAPDQSIFEPWGRMSVLLFF